MNKNLIEKIVDFIESSEERYELTYHGLTTILMNFENIYNSEFSIQEFVLNQISRILIDQDIFELFKKEFKIQYLFYALDTYYNTSNCNYICYFTFY